MAENVKWGKVGAVSPLAVRIAGDSVDTPIAMRNQDITLAVNDKVVLQLVGSAWVLMARIVAS